MPQDMQRLSLELLYNISRDLATTLDLHALLSSVLFLSVKNVSAERGTIVILDNHHSPIDAAIIYRDKLLTHTVQQIQDILNKGLMGWVLQNCQSVLVADTSKDERWLHHEDDSVDHSGPKSAICVPMIAHECLVGVLTIVHPKPNFFNKEHLNLLQAITDQAALAVNNSLLYESLQAAHNRYLELFEDSIDPILITDMQGKIYEANRQAIASTHYQIDELLQLNISDLHEISPDQMEKNVLQIENGLTLSYESNLLSQTHQLIPIEVYIRKVIFEEENHIQWTLRDISERKTLDIMRQDLAAMIYHDIKNPLSNILTSLDLVSSVINGYHDTFLDTVLLVFKRSAERMQRLVNSLLDIERLEVGQPIINKKIVKIHDLIIDVIQTIQSILESKEQTIDTKLPEALPDLQIDEDMIRRVFINLLENAIKYSPSEGHICIGGQVSDKMVELWIDDNGSIIPAESKEKIFEKYIRLRGENNPKGVGLGLAFCRLAIQAHGGNIWVETSPNHGNRFIFSLPITNGP